MAYGVGVVLGLFTCALARLAGFDRDRAFFPVILIVIASYYALFAVMGGSMNTLIVESIVITVFVANAVAGFRLNLWLVAAALAAHGIFDLVHGSFVANPGVPTWWPRFCLAYDVIVAAVLAFLLLQRLTVIPVATTSNKGSVKA